MFFIIMRNNILKNNQTFIIAEIGNNHEGNLQLAKKMIHEAWKCGVNAIKLQHIIPEKFFAEKKQILLGLIDYDFKNVQTAYKSSCAMPRRKINDIIINLDQRKRLSLNKGDRIITLSK